MDPDTVIVDISADHRLADDWAYGLPELFRDKIAGARRIANPGCYATALQLSVAPFLEDLAGVPAVFGVSGYSGAGTTPGPKNDPARLDDNLMPYSLVGHVHEQESSLHLGRQVRLMPHVHPAFRGLITTSHIPMGSPISPSDAESRLRQRYSDERLIEIQDVAPELRDGTGRLGVLMGGVEVSEDGRNLVLVAAEDNLLKGAAVQALQNLNLALGLPEFSGIL
jgi:N-acetyl-gamma-glutamyl-phosphate reductase common form